MNAFEKYINDQIEATGNCNPDDYSKLERTMMSIINKFFVMIKEEYDKLDDAEKTRPDAKDVKMKPLF